MNPLWFLLFGFIGSVTVVLSELAKNTEPYIQSLLIIIPSLIGIIGCIIWGSITEKRLEGSVKP